MIDNYNIDYSLATQFTKEYLIENSFLPIQKEELYIVVAISKKLKSKEILEDLFDTPVKYVTLEQRELEYLLSNLNKKIEIFKLYKESVEINNSDEKSFILTFIDKLIEFSLLKSSSDIHIEALQDVVSIRFRIDGYLETVFRFDLKFYPIVSSIVKLLSSLDISQKRIPQDGRFSKVIDNTHYDFRVSIIPTILGESIVIRILDNKSISKDLNKLGFNNNQLEDIKTSMANSSGLIVVTGPTGSGKTTTLYSILEELNDTSKKVITIEDPVEYNIEQIQQINLNESIGLTYSSVLKNILRQDPDIIMIGEIRDKESLKIAIQAALTGHLVITTLHTNDAVSTISRLIDLGLEPYLIGSTLKAIVSQRLVRKLCENCKEEVKVENGVFFTAKGCSSCNLKGYIRREVIAEVLNISPQLASLIMRNENEDSLFEYVKQNGFRTIYEDGIDKAVQGLTSLEEIYSTVSKR